MPPPCLLLSGWVFNENRPFDQSSECVVLMRLIALMTKNTTIIKDNATVIYEPIATQSLIVVYPRLIT